MSGSEPIRLLSANVAATDCLAQPSERTILKFAKSREIDTEVERLAEKREAAHQSFFAAFQRRYPTASYDEYDQQVRRGVTVSNVSGDELLRKILTDHAKTDKPDEGFIYAGNAYLVQASAAMEEYRLLDAAHLLMRAMLCSGVLLAMGSLENADAAVRADQRSSIAKTGSEGKKKLYEARMEMAHTIEKRLRPGNGWPSVRQAAIAVWGELKSMDLPGAKLSADQAVATVSKWLKDVPIQVKKKNSPN